MLAVPPRFDVRVRPIETERLRLLPLDASDASDMWLAVEASRPQLLPWLAWVPFNDDLEASARYAEASAAEWDAGHACRFALRDRRSRRFVGVVGLETLSHLHENANLGYWLHSEATGQGLMTEAGAAVLDWTFEQLGAHRVRIAAATDNHPSLAVIGRLGFQFEGIARQIERCNGRWLDHAQFALLRTDPRPKLRTSSRG